MKEDFYIRGIAMKLIESGRRFYKGNLHTHTTNSDGCRTPEEVMREYRDKGYDFLALTDHWKVGGERRFGNMLVLPGVEYDFDFPGQVLHVVGVLPDAACGERISRGMAHQDVIDAIHGCGGAAIVAHPAWSLNTPEMLASLRGVCAAEVYNTLSGVPWNAPRPDSAGILDVTAASTGALFRWVASDDSHFYTGEQCKSFTMVQADELSVPAVLSALREGRFYASQGPEFLEVERTEKRLIVRTSPVSACVFVSNLPWVSGRCRTGEGITESVYEIQPRDAFLRCEIIDVEGRRAWLSPIDLTV